MRMIRSLFCAGLAMMALAVCASMPAVAAVPMDAHAIVQPMTAADYPAPAVVVISQDVAVLPSEAPNIQVAASGRSSAFADSRSLASTSIAVEAYRHIDPDIAG